MPRVIQGSSDSSEIYVGKSYDYRYPNGLDLRPSSELHNKIVQKVMQRVDVSSEKMKTRHKSWREVDKTLTAYIPLTEAEQLLKDESPTTPVSIVFPHSYSILETLTAFMDGLFLKEPIFRYTGNSPEDELGAILLEKVIDTHAKRFKVGLSLHTAFKDGIAYGLGACFPLWKQKVGWSTTASLNDIGELTRVSEPKVLFEGNALENVDPYLLLLDPNYGVQAIQDSEFVGFVRRTNYFNLIEEDGNGYIFNVKYLKGTDNTSRYYAAKRDSKSQTTDVGDSSVLKPIDTVSLYIKIIPKDWGLSNLESPEKWLFVIAGDKTLIQAQPLDLDHDMFPIAICAPTFDGYSAAPIGRLELLGGMQKLLNWLFNSHVANVRKTLNDMIVYDPFVLNTADLLDPKPGKLVRVRRSAWGQGIGDAIKQLVVNDVTQQHVGDARITMSLMNQISGSDDAIMGTLREGGPERLSAAEFTGTQNQALGRLQSLAMIVGQQLMQDIGYMFAMNTKQLMSEDLYVDTIGEWQSKLSQVIIPNGGAQKMKVSPTDLNIDFDVVINRPDADNKSAAQFWVQMFDTIAKTPELYNAIDISRVFRYVAMLLGAQNVDEFLRMPMQPSVQPDAHVLQQAQAGNMVPAEEVISALGR